MSLAPLCVTGCTYRNQAGAKDSDAGKSAEPEKAADTLPFFYEDVDPSWVYSEVADHWDAHYSRCIENQLDVPSLGFACTRAG